MRGSIKKNILDTIWLLYRLIFFQFIVGNGYEAQQTAKKQTKMPRLGWKVHNCAQSFLLHRYIIYNQKVSIG